MKSFTSSRKNCQVKSFLALTRMLRCRPSCGLLPLSLSLAIDGVFSVRSIKAVIRTWFFAYHRDMILSSRAKYSLSYSHCLENISFAGDRRRAEKEEQQQHFVSEHIVPQVDQGEWRERKYLYAGLLRLCHWQDEMHGEGGWEKTSSASSSSFSPSPSCRCQYIIVENELTKKNAIMFWPNVSLPVWHNKILLSNDVRVRTTTDTRHSVEI